MNDYELDDEAQRIEQTADIAVHLLERMDLKVMARGAQPDSIARLLATLSKLEGCRRSLLSHLSDRDEPQLLNVLAHLRAQAEHEGRPA